MADEEIKKRDDDEAPEGDEADADEAEKAEEKPPKKKTAKREETAAKAAREEDDDASSDDDDEDAAPEKAEASSDEEAEDEGERDEAAARMAKALGVDDEAKTEEAAPAQEPEAPPNRAARRREDALERRKKRRGQTQKSAASDDDEPLPKDKNARAKALLQKRKEQASTDTRPINLLPGEMVDDALARSASAFSTWFKKNFSAIQWVVIAAVVGGAGFLGYTYFSQKKAAGASGSLMAAVADERGRVVPEDKKQDDKRSDEEKEFDQQKVFKSADERADTALAAYRQVAEQNPGTGAGMLARLGEAGALLEKRDYQKAMEAYQQVMSSPLAAADLDVKGRAIEGVGFAKEGKGDVDGALASFKELEGIDVKGYKELGEYHQARLLLGKGDKDKAKDLLKKAFDALKAPSADGHPFRFLENVVEESLRDLDPSAVPAKAPVGGPKGNAISPEELEKIMKRAREAAEKQPQGEHH